MKAPTQKAKPKDMFDEPKRDPGMEQQQQWLDMVNARGQHAVQPDAYPHEWLPGERERDLKTYYDTFGEHPTPGKGVLDTPEAKAKRGKR